MQTKMCAYSYTKIEEGIRPFKFGITKSLKSVEAIGVVIAHTIKQTYLPLNPCKFDGFKSNYICIFYFLFNFSYYIILKLRYNFARQNIFGDSGFISDFLNERTQLYILENLLTNLLIISA